jgi:hypothetical protein
MKEYTLDPAKKFQHRKPTKTGIRKVEKGRVITIPDPHHPKKTPPVQSKSRPAEEPSISGKRTSRLWRAFVKPHLKKPPNRDWMIVAMVPWLCIHMVPESVHGISMRYWNVNRSSWMASRDSRQQHSRETRAKVHVTWKLQLDSASKIHKSIWRQLTTENQRNGFVILLGIQKNSKGAFFLSERHFADRLALRYPTAARRVLERFVKLGFLKCIARGISRQEALANRQKAAAAQFLLSVGG